MSEFEIGGVSDFEDGVEYHFISIEIQSFVYDKKADVNGEMKRELFKRDKFGFYTDPNAVVKKAKQVMGIL